MGLIKKIIEWHEQTDKEILDKIADWSYEADEDIIVRHAREENRKKELGNKTLNIWMPGYHAFRGIRSTVQNLSISSKEKIQRSTTYLLVDVIKSVGEIGGAYVIYKFIDAYLIN